MEQVKQTFDTNICLIQELYQELRIVSIRVSQSITIKVERKHKTITGALV